MQYFYPRPPRGGRQKRIAEMEDAVQFLSTPSARRATEALSNTQIIKAISIHALREEGDLSRGRPRKVLIDFYPRPPRGGRPVDGADGGVETLISIHALREEGDGKENAINGAWMQISIHALREEGDLGARSIHAHHIHFYPRPPRGGRPAAVTAVGSMLVISIHALREEGDAAATAAAFAAMISIHALREEGDWRPFSASPRRRTFLSTPSARRATDMVEAGRISQEISIHALREEGDGSPCRKT